MRIRTKFLATMLTAVAASTALAAGNQPQPPPQPTMEFSAFFFLFPWMGPEAETLDPVDINFIDILFDTIEDSDANDNPHHP
ncbi:MAG TPA: hypothetical protein VFI49_12730 [Rudaea sp.]|nr:hypothetical protein [Rudaea sp.]